MEFQSKLLCNITEDMLKIFFHLQIILIRMKVERMNLALKQHLTRVINDYARKNGLLKEADTNLTGEDVREGLTAIVSIKHPDPQFEGQTKTKLGNSEVSTITNHLFSEGFERFLFENPTIARQSS